MDAEIDNLVKNFKRLWQSGISAHLDLDTHAGQAWMGLRVRLGHATGPHHQHQGHQKGGTRNSPSRQRRRERRAAAREKVAEEVPRDEAEAENEATTAIDNEVNQKEEASNQIPIAEQGIDEVCPNSEYNEKSKANKTDDVNETESFEFECWDPDGKWQIQDVYNHMGETLEQMFRVFDVEPKEQFYKLDIFERTNENFPMKIEIMKSKSVKAVMDNFRRQGHVEGGGCVKFFQKYL